MLRSAWRGLDPCRRARTPHNLPHDLSAIGPPHRGISTSHVPNNVLPNLVGQRLPSLDPRVIVESFSVTSPHTREELHRAQSSGHRDVEHAIDVAYQARQSWASTPISERSDIIRRAARLLEDESSAWKDRLYDSDRAETSVSEWWARQQLTDVAGFMKTLADLAPTVLAPNSRTEENWTVHTQHEPYGVCLAIAAWNAVHLLTTRAIVTPLLAGNTVILKTSELAPRTQSLWAELLFEAGLPEGCLNVLHVKPGEHHLVSSLIANDKIRHVNFTGSSNTGSNIASLAGKHLKPTLMELGGKAAALVLPDADLDAAASHLLFGAWMNAGEICMSTERIFVAESMYDKLVAALRSSWEMMQGKGSLPLASLGSKERIQGLIDEAQALGAAPLLPVEEREGPVPEECTLQPNIYGPINKQMKLYHRESFGPIAGIIIVPDGTTDQATVDTMLNLANESNYGLSASVWSRNEGTALEVAKRLESGAVHINGATCLDLPNTPHGGWKSSGWGRFNGAEGLRNFTQMRCITVPRAPPQALPLDILLR